MQCCPKSYPIPSFARYREALQNELPCLGVREGERGNKASEQKTVMAESG